MSLKSSKTKYERRSANSNYEYDLGQTTYLKPQTTDHDSIKSLTFALMNTVNLIGTGNVAWHLVKAIENSSSFSIQQIGARTPKSNKIFLKFSNDIIQIDALKPADITIIAVSDDAIASVSIEIPYDNSLVVHTSGSIEMQELSSKNRKGVFYPLQSFSKEINVDFSEVPICIEAADDSDLELLRNLALALSKNVNHIKSADRKQLHLAAVFANNFTNHCLTIAKELCLEKELSFSLLEPLINSTIKKAFQKTPYEAQTGPAKRDDKKVMEAHKDMLSKELHKKIYGAISASITSYYDKKL